MMKNLECNLYLFTYPAICVALIIDLLMNYLFFFYIVFIYVIYFIFLQMFVLTSRKYGLCNK